MMETNDCRLALLADRVAFAMGLHYPKERRNDLRRGIASAARDFGFKDADSCIEWLLSSSLTRHQIEVLASHLTVGETYFFREKKNLDVFTRSILKEIRERHKDNRCIRIWSAGCASGEEPYSIAISLRESMADLADWNVTILATDVNPRSLEKARQGVYRKWAFRQCPEAIKSQYFAETRSGTFGISPDAKKMVTFASHNLAKDVFPSPWNNTDNMDVIFCRNVLMYFAPDAARAALEKFYECLVDGGYLIVSPSEASPAFNPHFAPAYAPGHSIYQKTNSPRSPTEIEQSGVPSFSPPPLLVEEKAAKEFTSLPPPVVPVKPLPEGPPVNEPQIPQAVQEAEAIMKLARTRANEGELVEAARLCREGIAADKLSPSYYYLLAVVLHEQGQTEEAAGYLKRALYLDPDFVLAHFVLGNLMLKLGKAKESSRCFANVLALLLKSRPEEVVPDSEGVTVSQLLEVVRHEIEAVV